MCKITVGLSLHRPEMIPWIAERMRQHEAVFLEEPGSPEFQRMLSGGLAIGDYLLPLDVEYPNFSRAMCLLQRELHAEGKVIHQVEPFIETLIHIQEFFAEGGRPDELSPDSLAYHVYRAEKAATGALLAYYQTVVNGSFEDAVDSVIRFARVDAARFRLRDSLRAQELARLIPKYSTSYVEAGLMHYQLWRLLRRLLPSPAQVNPVFLAGPVLQSLAEKGHLYSPGDQLTLLYILHPNISRPGRERLLAAQAMVYSKILEKQESDDDAGAFRHLRDELACIHAVRHLSLDDCRRLFPGLRRASTLDARRTITTLLSERHPESGWVRS
jgi:hypothetical protein